MPDVGYSNCEKTGLAGGLVGKNISSRKIRRRAKGEWTVGDYRN